MNFHQLNTKLKERKKEQKKKAVGMILQLGTQLPITHTLQQHHEKRFNSIMMESVSSSSTNLEVALRSGGDQFFKSLFRVNTTSVVFLCYFDFTAGDRQHGE